MPESLDKIFLQQVLAARDAKVFYKEIAIADAIIQGDLETVARLTNASLNTVQTVYSKTGFNLPIFDLTEGQQSVGTLSPDMYRQLLLKTVVELEPDTHEVIEYPETDFLLPETREQIMLYSPSLRLLEQLRTSQMSLHNLHWRQLEELVAELLVQAGYQVELGRGTKDEGVDIIAMKEDPIHGLFRAVWQAKKLKEKNKVGLNIIRELNDTRLQHNATKGIIVTTTSLTDGALKRIEQDRYLLGKVDGNDLSYWIQKGK